MTAGRKKKPTNMHVINGTDRPCRRNDDEPQPDLLNKIPDPPSFLSDYAVEEWFSMSEKLYSLGLLSNIDTSAFSLYCQSWGEFVEAQEKINGNIEKGTIGTGLTITTDKGNELQHPLVSISHTAMTLCHKFLSEFGMTPSSRSKVKVSDPGKKKNKFSENTRKKAS